jgi:hypothetical protein
VYRVEKTTGAVERIFEQLYPLPWLVFRQDVVWYSVGSDLYRLALKDAVAGTGVLVRNACQFFVVGDDSIFCSGAPPTRFDLNGKPYGDPLALQEFKDVYTDVVLSAGDHVLLLPRGVSAPGPSDLVSYDLGRSEGVTLGCNLPALAAFDRRQVLWWEKPLDVTSDPRASLVSISY